MQAETSAHQPVNHVFVDFENVKSIDASVLGGRSVRLNLFLGPQNKKLDVEVVEKLLENAQAVQLVRSRVTVKNGLDFVLAYHLGQAVLADPKGYFHIVAKDKGYESLVDLLKSRNVKVKKHDDWSGLNFQAAPKPTVANAPTPAAPQAPAKPQGGLSEAGQKLLENLKKSPKNRPKKEKTLIAHAMNFTGKDKPGAEANAIKAIEELKKAKRIVVDEKGAVSYKVEG